MRWSEKETARFGSPDPCGTASGILGLQGTVTVPLLFLYRPLREQERVLSLLLGSPGRKVATAPAVATPACPARAVYSWKWSRYETKREGIALLAGEKEASNVSSADLSSPALCPFFRHPRRGKANERINSSLSLSLFILVRCSPFTRNSFDSE